MRDILITGELETGRGNRRSFTVIFFYELSPKIKTAGPRFIVPTKFTDLPEDIQDAGLLQPEEIAELNDGSAAFEQMGFKKAPGESNQAALARLVLVYETSKTKFIDALRLRYGVADLFVDATTAKAST